MPKYHVSSGYSLCRKKCPVLIISILFLVWELPNFIPRVYRVGKFVDECCSLDITTICGEKLVKSKIRVIVYVRKCGRRPLDLVGDGQKFRWLTLYYVDSRMINCRTWNWGYSEEKLLSIFLVIVTFSYHWRRNFKNFHLKFEKFYCFRIERVQMKKGLSPNFPIDFWCKSIWKPSCIWWKNDLTREPLELYDVNPNETPFIN